MSCAPHFIIKGKLAQKGTKLFFFFLSTILGKPYWRSKQDCLLSNHDEGKRMQSWFHPPPFLYYFRAVNRTFWISLASLLNLFSIAFPSKKDCYLLLGSLFFNWSPRLSPAYCCSHRVFSRVWNLGHKPAIMRMLRLWQAHGNILSLNCKEKNIFGKLTFFRVRQFYAM